MSATSANASALVNLATFSMASSSKKSCISSGFLKLNITARDPPGMLAKTSGRKFTWLGSHQHHIGTTVFTVTAHRKQSTSGKSRLSCSCNIPNMYYKVRLRHQEVWRQSSSTTSSYIEEIEHDISRGTLIWRAIKLPIYSVALVPLTVASAVAYFQTGIFLVGRFFVILGSSVLIILWLNLSNDVYDYDTGADKNKKESVVNLMGSRTGVLAAAFVFLFMGFIGLTLTAVDVGSWRSILLLASAITCGYIYQCPPFRLSYKGLGEPLCFAAFGPFATTAFYLLQSTTSELPITGTVLSASLLVGLTTTLILFCSHFHQVDGDRAVGKISPLVRVGTKVGSEAVKIAVLALYGSLLLFGLCRTIPLPCVMLCAMTIPIGNLVVGYVQTNHEDKSKIFMAKYYCVRLHAMFGAALAAGLVATRFVNPILP